MKYKLANFEGVYYSLPESEDFLNDQNYNIVEQDELVITELLSGLKESAQAPRLSKFLDHYFTKLFLNNLKVKIYDIGGYVGVFGFNFANHFRLNESKANIEVNIFEPTPLNENIKHTIKLNNFSDSVTVHAMAISSEKAVLGYYAKENKLISGRLYNFPGSEKMYDVEVNRLDDFKPHVLSNDIVNIIKIDTEGHELKVFDGGREMIEFDNSILFLEYWPWLEERDNNFGMSYHEYLLKHFHVIDINTVGFPRINEDSYISTSGKFKSLIKQLNDSNRGTTDLLCVSKNFGYLDDLKDLLNTEKYPS